MAVEVRPATRFDDVATMVGPKRPGAEVCWCLSHRRLTTAQRALRGQDRSDLVRDLVAQDPPPGVLAYEGAEVVGWAAVAPRRNTSFARSRKIPHLDAVDAVDVWSLWCLRVRPGHRKQGIVHHLIAGAVDFARTNDAPAIEAYPLDNKGAKIDQSMAYAGTRAAFEAAGFTRAAATDSVLSGFPRVLMRLDLR